MASNSSEKTIASENAQPTGEGVADHRPLGLAKEAEQLAEVVDEPGQDEPARPSVRPERLRGLQGVVDLREVEIGIAVVDDLAEMAERVPHTHATASQGQVLAPLRLDERDGLIRVVQGVEVADAGASVLIEAAIRGRRHAVPRSFARARGRSPCSSRARSDAISRAAAPSLIWLETAAVRRPPSSRLFKAAIFSSDVPRRTVSSISNSP